MSDEDDLFSQEMADVTPLSEKRSVVYLKSSSPAERREAEEARLKALDNPLTQGFLDIIALDEPLDYKDPGVQQGVLDKLRKGKYPTQATLNLLRKPVAECRQMLFDFYLSAQENQWRTLLIVHGRGRDANSHANIIRSYVAKWLKQLDQVQAYCEAQKQDGGAGACYVVLKKSAQAKQHNWERHAKHSR
ncbi:DNA endonuclease SmrA [Chimaeribacter arupi]|uniref:DNA endonuclease SmrA n=2 Tax=Yersiniaceae TaxID=1903411 RepID=A0A2N5ER33_9GAMM|nr:MULTISPECIES: DNA endonuclease SmrA [Yersiniaceae]MBS0970928.1 DNA endonuclease SmrA [Nissabacter archeti]MDV5139135.1 DNA endonuclease SmrA [Chimaeribacter arupi]PLR36667.1 DNA endonuclease SmrA [Chimaeribacter arupi]PLR43195.1 DNA endonuclease SmrA [Chimaeribacter arupi]PLR48549.1 DNA endonuclease SmrA [Chimaeribacter arupi]